MPDEILDGSAASSTATTDPSADTSAGTQNTDQANGQPQYRGFHEHPDWQRMVAERRQDRETITALQRQIQGLSTAREQTGQPMSDEERQLREARDAFYGKVAPELKDVAQQLQVFAQDRFVSSGERMIETFARQHGFDAKDLTEDIADAIKQDQMLMARAKRGDASIIPLLLRSAAAAARSYQKRSADTARTTASATAQTKIATTKLPPNTNGGVPGEPVSPVPELLKQGDERGARASMHERAIRLAKGLMG